MKIGEFEIEGGQTMSKKWLEREGPKWVEKAIVSDEQLQQIRALYMQKGSGVALLTFIDRGLI